MKANEFRLGNLVYYHIEDSMDERKEWDEVSPIDYDDLRCFVQYEDNSEYRPIPLTEEWLLKFGFKKQILHSSICYSDFYSETMAFRIYYPNEDTFTAIHCKPDITEWYPILINSVKYVHQLQNLYFALIGQELTLK